MPILAKAPKELRVLHGCFCVDSSESYLQQAGWSQAFSSSWDSHCFGLGFRSWKLPFVRVIAADYELFKFCSPRTMHGAKLHFPRLQDLSVGSNRHG